MVQRDELAGKRIKHQQIVDGESEQFRGSILFNVFVFDPKSGQTKLEALYIKQESELFLQVADGRIWKGSK